MSRIIFKKEGRAKYISHLDLMRTMQRVFIRSGVVIKHTEGYNPHPYMAFALPLSVGTESDYELMDFKLIGGAELSEIPGLITKNSPEGITVLEAYEENRKTKEMKWLEVDITLSYDGGAPAGAVEAIRELYSRESLVVSKTSKGKTRDENIAPLIDRADISERDGGIFINAVISCQDPPLSPAVMLSAIDAYLPLFRPDFVAIRRKMIYDREKKQFR